MYSPRFTITNEILTNIGTIEAAREVIDHAPLLPYYEKQFQEEALVRTVHHGTHIEGNELDLAQAEKVLLGQNVVARVRDIQEVINYRRVMEYLNKSQISHSTSSGQANLKSQIDEDMIKEIHRMTVERILDASQCGVYRSTQVVVRNSQTGNVSFRPPTAVEVVYQMADFVHWLAGEGAAEVHPVLKAGIVHYEIVRIHPFLDGNGRVARSLSTLVLFKEGYDIRRFFSIEEYFDNNASDYYKALQSVEEEDGDLTKWLSYFTHGLAIELTKVKEKVQRLSVDIKLKDKLGQQVILTERQIKIIEYMQKTGYLQNKAFETLFPMVSEDTILRELQELVKRGIIRKQGVTKAAKYVLNTYAG
ncbi:Fic family protein [Candidatus Microgenomates bacterium]|nr:Fic family protein [Candidatus Microgenomates bacterium]